jgi:hypothetical protein
MQLPPLVMERFRRLPTTDLYVLNPLRELRRRHEKAISVPPLRHVAGNTFSIGRTGIVSRYGGGDDVARLEKLGVKSIVYVADDDFAAGAEDRTLPEKYRAKLAAFVEGGWPVLKQAADVVLVASPPLAAIYGDKARMVHPVWSPPPRELGQFDRPKRFEIAHLGTASHRSEFAAFAPILAELLREHSHARLTFFSDGTPPAALDGHPQVRLRAPMAWWRYKLALPRMRFHLALYPLRDTPFNAGRSANKLFEHALVGAASLMSPIPALRDAAGPAGRAIFIEGDAEQWHQRIEADIADPEACRTRAEAARRRIAALDPAGAAAELWLDILAGET